ncbi:MAG: hypothetical protein AAB932_00135 [Patescibacteria group bacterium]
MKEACLSFMGRKGNLFFLMSLLVASILFMWATPAGATSVGNSVVVTNNTTLGDATTTDITYVNSRFAGDLEATANNALDLGAFANAWRHVYASGTGYFDAVSTTGHVTFGDTTSSDIIYLNARVASDIEASVNNQSDLGGYGNAWRDVFVSGTLYVGTLTSLSANLSLDGNTTLGNATSTDILYINSRLAGSLIPTSNNDADLGEFARAYNDIFSSGTSYLGAVSTTGHVTFGDTTSSDIIYLNARVASDIEASVNNQSDLGGYGNAWRDVFVSGTLYVGTLTNLSANLSLDGNTTLGNATTTDVLYLNARIAADLEPTADNALDLGQFGNAWRNVYSSGTAYFGAVSTTGHVTFGDATSSDIIYLNSRFASDIEASVNNQSDLGGYGNAWRTLYASTSLIIGDVVSSTAAITDHLSGLIGLDIPTAASSTFKCTTGTAYFGGVTAGDSITVAPQTFDQAFEMGSLWAFSTATNYVGLTYCSGGGQNDADPADINYRIDVWKH